MGLSLLPTVVVPECDIQVERTGAMIGRYKLLEKIGEGGFGTVFMAEQVEPVQRKVALKIIKAGMDTKEVIARFEAERQAIALMDHPSIARALDAGTTQAGRPYFVMELVRGIAITDYCDQANLPTRERLQLFMKVCQAVQHAHQKGVIHRDLKPSNVLVTEHDGAPVPKVIDFGVAKALGQRLTEKTLFTGFQHMIGTPAYMSPEQAALSGLDIDTRADIYSLGVLLYELLTGATPFDADTFRKAALDEIRRMIRETEPPKPSTRLRTLGDKLPEVAKHRHTEPAALSRLVRGDLDWIVMKCLEKDRTRRYETANGLAVDVEHHLNNEPVVARPPSNLYRLRKLVRRNRLTFATAGMVAFALMAGLAISTRMYLREQQARRRAVVAEQAERLSTQRAQAAERRAQDEARQLGDALYQLGDLHQAERFLKDSLEMQKKVIGEENLEVATTLHSLGQVLIRQGKLTEAEPVLNQALTMRQELLGNRDPNLADSFVSLASVFQLKGKLAEAEKLLRQALECVQTDEGGEAPGENSKLGLVLHHLADVLLERNSTAGASPFAEQAVALYERHPEWPLTEREHAFKVRDSVLTRAKGNPGRQPTTNSEPSSWRGSAETSQPLSAAFFATRGWLFARESRWREAAADYAKAIEMEPRRGREYISLAALLVAEDNLEDYRRLCQRILSRFASTEDPLDADKAAKACLILPSSGADPNAVKQLADIAVTKDQEGRLFSYRQCTKGLLEYRQGRFQSAIEWERKALHFETPDEGRAMDGCVRILAYAVLAMAHHELGQPDKCSAVFTKAATLSRNDSVGG